MLNNNLIAMVVAVLVAYKAIVCARDYVQERSERNLLRLLMSFAILASALAVVAYVLQ
jgi:hypothetical protein